MIFIPGSYRRTRAGTGKIIAALGAILAHYPGEADLANGEVTGYDPAANRPATPHPITVRDHGLCREQPRADRCSADVVPLGEGTPGKSFGLLAWEQVCRRWALAVSGLAVG